MIGSRGGQKVAVEEVIVYNAVGRGCAPRVIDCAQKSLDIFRRVVQTHNGTPIHRFGFAAVRLRKRDHVVEHSGSRRQNSSGDTEDLVLDSNNDCVCREPQAVDFHECFRIG
jgi:hypothetical protein